MSRRDDDSDDEEAVERPRRRRRAGGLRIPSDNVPRHSGSQPVMAPVPEDPGVAMSIAYAFNDESGPRNLGRLDDDGDDTAIGARPEAPAGSFPSLDDVVPDGRTRQMPAVSLEALGLSADDDLGLITSASPPTDPVPEAIQDSVDVELDDEDGVPLVTAPVPRFADVSDGTNGHGREHPAATAAERSRPPSTKTPPVPLSDDDLVELEDAGAGPVPVPHGARRHPATQPSRPPEVAVGERTTLPMPAVTPPDALPSVIVSFSPPAAAAMPPPVPPPVNGPGPTTAPSLAAVAAPITAPMPAQPTMVGVPPGPASGPAASMPSAPAVEVPDEDEHSLSDGWTMPVDDRAGDAEPIALAPADAVLDDGLEPVPGPADASDSGEILAEELMDDEEHARATPVTTVAAAPAPPAPPAAVPGPPPPPVTTPPTPAAAPPAAAPPPAPVRPPPAPAVARPPAPPPTLRAPTPAPELDADGKKKRRGRPWFEEVFDEDYLRTLPYLTPAATQSEARMVVEALELGAGASVLDLGCGYGRHAMELAARGMHVVGVDLSLPLLLRGADEAQRRGLDINFVHADMREIDFDAQFDGAYCLFSTFGYFDDDTNKKVASLIGKALRPGGRFVLQVLNRDYVIGDLPTRVWWEGDGCVVLEEVDFNYFSSRIQSKRSVVFDDARQVEQEISIRAYSLHEIGKLLHAAGLRVVEVSGGMTTRGRFLGNRSREILVIADRPK